MAIVTAAAKVSAHVAAFGRVKPSKFEDSGPIQSIKFVSSDGTTEHWATFPAEQAQAFKMQQQVNLIPTQRRGRDTWDIEPLEPANYQPPQQPLGFQVAPQPQSYQPQPVQAPGPQQPAGVNKKEIAAFITGQADLMGFCRSQAARVLPEGDPPEVQQAAAAALFISASRKFNLER